MKKPNVVFLLATIIVLTAQLVFSQVTIETYTTSNGISGKGAFESNIKTILKGDAQRTETQFKFTGSIMKHMNKKGTDIEITRLDKELFWHFDDQNKKYSEQTFAEIKAMIEQGTNPLDMPAQPEMEQEDEEADSEYEWQEPVVKLDKTGEKEKINNFNCEHYIISVTTVGKHKATGISDTLLFVNDTWNTTDANSAMEQTQNFNQKLSEKLGFENIPQKGFSQFLNAYKDQMSEMKKELDKVQGYPIKSEMVLTTTNHVKQQTTPDEENDEEESVDVTDLKGSFGGMFGKKLKKMAKKEKANEPKLKTEVFQVVTETKNISYDTPKDELFTVPQGYKLK